MLFMSTAYSADDYTLSKANITVAFFADVVVVKASCASVNAQTLCECLQISNPEFSYTCVMGPCSCKKSNCSMTVKVVATTFGGNVNGNPMRVRDLPLFMSECSFRLDEYNTFDTIIVAMTISLYVVGGVVALIILSILVRCCALCMLIESRRRCPVSSSRIYAVDALYQVQESTP